MHESIIRAASMDDLAQIVQVKTATWPEDETNVALIRAALVNPDHCVIVSEIDGQIAGFVDGFMTITASGEARWEVDLLAVMPAVRGLGVGKRLVEASTTTGQKRGAALCRALIQVQNTASQQVFAHSHYTKLPTDVEIFVAQHPLAETMPPPDGHWLPVYTFNYHGIWIEKCFDQASLAHGRWLINHHQVELAGALIPIDNTAGQQSAAQLNYESVGQYSLWIHRFTTVAG